MKLDEMFNAGARSYGIGDITIDLVTPLWGFVGVASAAVCIYHGYKRNCGSLGWALGWGLLGGLMPVVTPVIAFAQGLGKPLPTCSMR
jgi:hypothetical protein